MEFISIHKIDEVKPEDFAIFNIIGSNKSVLQESIKLLKENLEYQPVVRMGFYSHIYGDVKMPLYIDYLPAVFIGGNINKINLPYFKDQLNINIDNCTIKSKINDGSNFPVRNTGSNFENKDLTSTTILVLSIDNDVIQVKFPSLDLLDDKKFKDSLLNNLIVMKNAKNLEKELVTKDNLQTKKIKI